jgi:hypothetical protein
VTAVDLILNIQYRTFLDHFHDFAVQLFEQITMYRPDDPLARSEDCMAMFEKVHSKLFVLERNPYGYWYEGIRITI